MSHLNSHQSLVFTRIEMWRWRCPRTERQRASTIALFSHLTGDGRFLMRAAPKRIGAQTAKNPSISWADDTQQNTRRCALDARWMSEANQDH